MNAYIVITATVLSILAFCALWMIAALIRVAVRRFRYATPDPKKYVARALYQHAENALIQSKATNGRLIEELQLADAKQFAAEIRHFNCVVNLRRKLPPSAPRVIGEVIAFPKRTH